LDTIDSIIAFGEEFEDTEANKNSTYLKNLRLSQGPNKTSKTNKVSSLTNIEEPIQDYRIRLNIKRLPVYMSYSKRRYGVKKQYLLEGFTIEGHPKQKTSFEITKSYKYSIHTKYQMALKALEILNNSQTKMSNFEIDRELKKEKYEQIDDTEIENHLQTKHETIIKNKLNKTIDEENNNCPRINLPLHVQYVKTTSKKQVSEYYSIRDHPKLDGTYITPTNFDVDLTLKYDNVIKALQIINESKNKIKVEDVKNKMDEKYAYFKEKINSTLSKRGKQQRNVKRKIPDGYKDDDIPRYCVYKNNGEREYFMIENHPNLSGSYSTTSVKTVTLAEKLDEIKKVTKILNESKQQISRIDIRQQLQ